MARSKIRVNTSPVANAYSAPDEKIIEYSYPDGSSGVPGGLISFRWITPEDGPPFLYVDLYRHDSKVRIHVGKGDGD